MHNQSEFEGGERFGENGAPHALIGNQALHDAGGVVRLLPVLLEHSLETLRQHVSESASVRDVIKPLSQRLVIVEPDRTPSELLVGYHPLLAQIFGELQQLKGFKHTKTVLVHSVG